MKQDRRIGRRYSFNASNRGRDAAKTPGGGGVAPISRGRSFRTSRLVGLGSVQMDHFGGLPFNQTHIIQMSLFTQPNMRGFSARLVVCPDTPRLEITAMMFDCITSYI